MDATNAGIPGPGGQLSGDASRQAAIKRLQMLEKLKKSRGGIPGMVGPPSLGTASGMRP